MSLFRHEDQNAPYFEDMANREARVLRGGSEQTVRHEEILVGDVVVLVAGEKTPADGFVIASKDLRVDQSSLTGEPELVPRSPNPNDRLIWAECPVSGAGTMLVLAVGENTMFGSFSAQLL